MDSNQIIALILSALPGIGIFIFQEIPKNIIGRFFSNASPKQINLYFIILLLIFISIPFVVGVKFHNDNQNINTTNITVVPQKTDGEIILQGVNDGIVLIKEVSKKKHKNDSIKRATKEQMWVYQLGVPTNDISVVWELYKNLKDVGVEVLEEPKNNFIVFKNYDYTEQQSNDSLESFKTLFPNVGASVKIKNLMEVCSLNKKIIRDSKGKLQRKHKEIHCYSCSK